MKNLVYATAMAIGSLTPLAAHPPIFHDGIMELIIAQDFTEIAKGELPSAISRALEKDYAEYSVVKVFVNGEEEYKVEISDDKGSVKELYADALGNWLDI